MAHDRPNFVIFYTDDQGYGDLHCMGARDLKTPHIDRIAERGVRFTNWYSGSPVCSPSRAAVLTGRYPCHAGVRSILSGHRRATGLPQSTPTIATALRELGYRTAMFGKWHLGVAEESMPHNHGFDEWFGFLAGCIDYFSHIFYWGQGPGHDPVHDLWENGKEVWENGLYFTEAITEHAIDYLVRTEADDRPFLLYIPYNAPHYPMHAPPEYTERFARLPWDRQIMAAMLNAVDDSVGHILEEIEDQGRLENTLVFYQSDNGPSRETRNWLDDTRDPYHGGTAGPLKGHKFSLFEGGIRMPAVMSWPAVVPAGGVVHETGAAMDIFPTFLSAAGGDPGHYGLDGLDVLPMVAHGAPTPHERLFWEMGDQTAIRRGKWKLVLNGQLVEGRPPEDAVFLADMDTDMGERTNLAAELPEIAGDLKSAAEAWRAGIEEHWNAHFAGAAHGLA